MGDVLAGSNAVWDLASDAVVIRYSRGVRGTRLLQALGERRVPHGALEDVELAEGRRGTVVLRAVVRPGADPVMEAADGQLKAGADPYRLVLPEQSRELAESSRQTLLAAIDAAGGGPGLDPPSRFLVAAPGAPRSFKAYDAKVSFDGREVAFRWFWTGATTGEVEGGRPDLPGGGAGRGGVALARAGRARPLAAAAAGARRSAGRGGGGGTRPTRTRPPSCSASGTAPCTSPCRSLLPSWPPSAPPASAPDPAGTVPLRTTSTARGRSPQGALGVPRTESGGGTARATGHRPVIRATSPQGQDPRARCGTDVACRAVPRAPKQHGAAPHKGTPGGGSGC